MKLKTHVYVKAKLINEISLSKKKYPNHVFLNRLMIINNMLDYYIFGYILKNKS